MSSWRSPLVNASRTVLLYPADEDEPRVTLINFSQSGAKSYSPSRYTRTLDLEESYGKFMLHAREDIMHVFSYDDDEDEDGGDGDGDGDEESRGGGASMRQIAGMYVVYYNVHPKLGVNRSLAGIVGVDQRRPGGVPFWRGDVIVARCQPWLQSQMIPTVDGRSHIDWLDIVSKSMLQEYMKKYFREKYRSEAWVGMIEGERRRLYEMSQDVIMRKSSLYDRCEELIHALQRFKNKQREREYARKCANCTTPPTAEKALKACARCRKARYCSVECQIEDWGEHKRVCRPRT